MEETLQDIWEKRISAYRKSGQTMKAWCSEQNLKVHQLKYWLYKDSKRQGMAQASATFRAVAVIAPQSKDDSLWVQVGSARITVHQGFEPQLLRDVVAALASEC